MRVVEQWKKPRKLSEAREIYKVGKFFVEERRYRFGSSYVAESCKELVDMFEKRCGFKLELNLTVKDEEMVTGWDKL